MPGQAGHPAAVRHCQGSDWRRKQRELQKKAGREREGWSGGQLAEVTGKDLRGEQAA